MPEIYSNFARSTLATGINNAVTTLDVAGGEGALFPNPASGEYFTAFLISADGLTKEALKVTARAGDTFGTIVRAQQGSAAAAFAAGATVLHGNSKDAMTRHELGAAHAALALLDSGRVY